MARESDKNPSVDKASNRPDFVSYISMSNDRGVSMTFHTGQSPYLADLGYLASISDGFVYADFEENDPNDKNKTIWKRKKVDLTPENLAKLQAIFDGYLNLEVRDGKLHITEISSEVEVAEADSSAPDDVKADTSTKVDKVLDKKDLSELIDNLNADNLEGYGLQVDTAETANAFQAQHAEELNQRGLRVVSLNSNVVVTLAKPGSRSKTDEDGNYAKVDDAGATRMFNVNEAISYLYSASEVEGRLELKAFDLTQLSLGEEVDLPEAYFVTGMTFRNHPDRNGKYQTLDKNRWKNLSASRFKDLIWEVRPLEWREKNLHLVQDDKSRKLKLVEGVPQKMLEGISTTLSQRFAQDAYTMEEGFDTAYWQGEQVNLKNPSKELMDWLNQDEDRKLDAFTNEDGVLSFCLKGSVKRVKKALDKLVGVEASEIPNARDILAKFKLGEEVTFEGEFTSRGFICKLEGSLVKVKTSMDGPWADGDLLSLAGSLNKYEYPEEWKEDNLCLKIDNGRLVVEEGIDGGFLERVYERMEGDHRANPNIPIIWHGKKENISDNPTEEKCRFFNKKEDRKLHAVDDLGIKFYKTEPGSKSALNEGAEISLTDDEGNIIILYSSGTLNYSPIRQKEGYLYTVDEEHAKKHCRSLNKAFNGELAKEGHPNHEFAVEGGKIVLRLKGAAAAEEAARLFKELDEEFVNYPFLYLATLVDVRVLTHISDGEVWKGQEVGDLSAEDRQELVDKMNKALAPRQIKVGVDGRGIIRCISLKEGAKHIQVNKSINGELCADVDFIKDGKVWSYYGHSNKLIVADINASGEYVFRYETLSGDALQTILEKLQETQEATLSKEGYPNHEFAVKGGKIVLKEKTDASGSTSTPNNGRVDNSVDDDTPDMSDTPSSEEQDREDFLSGLRKSVDEGKPVSKADISRAVDRAKSDAAYVLSTWIKADKKTSGETTNLDDEAPDSGGDAHFQSARRKAFNSLIKDRLEGGDASYPLRKAEPLPRAKTTKPDSKPDEIEKITGKLPFPDVLHGPSDREKTPTEYSRRGGVLRKFQDRITLIDVKSKGNIVEGSLKEGADFVMDKEGVVQFYDNEGKRITGDKLETLEARLAELLKKEEARPDSATFLDEEVLENVILPQLERKAVHLDTEDTKISGYLRDGRRFSVQANGQVQVADVLGQSARALTVDSPELDQVEAAVLRSPEYKKLWENSVDLQKSDVLLKPKNAHNKVPLHERMDIPEVNGFPVFTKEELKAQLDELKAARCALNAYAYEFANQRYSEDGQRTRLFLMQARRTGWKPKTGLKNLHINHMAVEGWLKALPEEVREFQEAMVEEVMGAHVDTSLTLDEARAFKAAGFEISPVLQDEINAQAQAAEAVVEETDPRLELHQMAREYKKESARFHSVEEEQVALKQQSRNLNEAISLVGRLIPCNRNEGKKEQFSRYVAALHAVFKDNERFKDLHDAFNAMPVGQWLTMDQIEGLKGALNVAEEQLNTEKEAKDAEVGAFYEGYESRAEAFKAAFAAKAKELWDEEYEKEKSSLWMVKLLKDQKPRHLLNHARNEFVLACLPEGVENYDLPRSWDNEMGEAIFGVKYDAHFLRDTEFEEHERNREELITYIRKFEGVSQEKLDEFEAEFEGRRMLPKLRKRLEEFENEEGNLRMTEDQMLALAHEFASEEYSIENTKRIIQQAIKQLAKDRKRRAGLRDFYESQEDREHLAARQYVLENKLHERAEEMYFDEYIKGTKYPHDTVKEALLEEFRQRKEDGEELPKDLEYMVKFAVDVGSGRLKAAERPHMQERARRMAKAGVEKTAETARLLAGIIPKPFQFGRDILIGKPGGLRNKGTKVALAIAAASAALTTANAVGGALRTGINLARHGAWEAVKVGAKAIPNAFRSLKTGWKATAAKFKDWWNPSLWQEERINDKGEKEKYYPLAAHKDDGLFTSMNKWRKRVTRMAFSPVAAVASGAWNGTIGESPEMEDDKVKKPGSGLLAMASDIGGINFEDMWDKSFYPWAFTNAAEKKKEDDARKAKEAAGEEVEEKKSFLAKVIDIAGDAASAKEMLKNPQVIKKVMAGFSRAESYRKHNPAWTARSYAAKILQEMDQKEVASAMHFVRLIPGIPEVVKDSIALAATAYSTFYSVPETATRVREFLNKAAEKGVDISQEPIVDVIANTVDNNGKPDLDAIDAMLDAANWDSFTTHNPIFKLDKLEDIDLESPGHMGEMRHTLCTFLGFEPGEGFRNESFHKRVTRQKLVRMRSNLTDLNRQRDIRTQSIHEQLVTRALISLADYFLDPEHGDERYEAVMTLGKDTPLAQAPAPRQPSQRVEAVASATSGTDQEQVNVELEEAKRNAKGFRELMSETDVSVLIQNKHYYEIIRDDFLEKSENESVPEYKSNLYQKFEAMGGVIDNIEARMEMLQEAQDQGVAQVSAAQTPDDARVAVANATADVTAPEEVEVKSLVGIDQLLESDDSNLIISQIEKRQEIVDAINKKLDKQTSFALSPANASYFATRDQYVNEIQSLEKLDVVKGKKTDRIFNVMDGAMEDEDAA